MNLTDFDFELPEQLIAQHPSGIRGNDRLMEMNRITGEVIHHAMEELPDLLKNQVDDCNELDSVSSSKNRILRDLEDNRA